jgi:hypothetical protein
LSAASTHTLNFSSIYGTKPLFASLFKYIPQYFPLSFTYAI